MNDRDNEMVQAIAKAVNAEMTPKGSTLPEPKKKGFLADGLSIDESRASSLIMAMVVLVGLCTFQVVKQGDVATNLMELSKIGLLAVAGASGLNAMAKTR